MAPIGYDKVRKETGEHVDPDDIIRGSRSRRAASSSSRDEDIDRLDIELTHAIDICDFVSLDEIDPIHFRKAYYLLPQDGAEKPYRLLVRALAETGRVGDRQDRDPQQAAPRGVRPCNDGSCSRRCTTPTRCGSREVPTCSHRSARPRSRWRRR